MTAPAIDDTTFAGHEAVRLAVDELAAIFLPSLGMLCVSLTRGGEEILGRTDELDSYIEKGSTIGIPLLHPWANRLAYFQYQVAGRSVLLDRTTPLLHYDTQRQPMHGVPGARLPFEIDGQETSEREATISARLPWLEGDVLEVFPFPHWFDLDATLDAGGLTIETTVTPRADVPVPIAFGFHPYLRLPGSPRSEWKLSLPPLRRLALDDRGIPNGVEQLFSWEDGPLGEQSFDHAFRILQPRPRFTVSAGSRQITVAFLEGYNYAQIYAPKDRDFIAIEPMTAPGNALVSGHGLRTVPTSGTFRSSFRVEF